MEKTNEFFVITDEYGHQVYPAEIVTAFDDFNSAYDFISKRLKQRPTERYFICKAMWVCEANCKDISITVTNMKEMGDCPF